MKRLFNRDLIYAFVMIVFFGLALYYAISYRNCQYNKVELERELVSLKDKVHNFNEKERLKLQMNHQTIEPIVLFDAQDNNISIGKIINCPKLVFRFTEQFCTPCIESALASLNELGKVIGFDNIIMITDVRNTRLLKIFIARYNIQSPCYSYPGRLNFEIEHKSGGDRLPFYMIIDKNLQVSFPCFANENDGLISIYLDIIKKNFQNQIKNNSTI